MERMPESDCVNQEADFVYTELEMAFVKRFLALFARVDAQRPHKGIRTLIVRARQKAEQANMPLQAALEEVYEGALMRTERRIQLIQQCTLNKSDF